MTVKLAIWILNNMSFDTIQVGDMRFGIENIDFFSISLDPKPKVLNGDVFSEFTGPGQGAVEIDENLGLENNEGLCELVLLYTGDEADYNDLEIPDPLPDQASPVLPLVHFIDSQTKAVSFVFRVTEIAYVDGCSSIVKMRVPISFAIPPDLSSVFSQTIIDRPKFSEYKSSVNSTVRALEKEKKNKYSHLDLD